MANINVGDEITLYNIDVDGVRQISSNIALTAAGFTYATPAEEESSEPTSEDISEEVSEEVSEVVSEETSSETSEPEETGYDFMSSALDVKVNEGIVGESVRIFTTNEALASSNTNWSVNVLLKKVGEDLYEVISVTAGTGTNYAGTLGEDEILLAVHSSSSNPEDIGTYQNVYGKLAAAALEAGDKLTIVGIADGTITALETYSEPEEDSSVASTETSDETPITGDTGIIALAVISVIALAGAVVIKRR